MYWRVWLSKQIDKVFNSSGSARSKQVSVFFQFLEDSYVFSLYQPLHKVQPHHSHNRQTKPRWAQQKLKLLRHKMH